MRPRLFLRVVSQELRTRLSYRLDFWLNAVVGFLAQFGLVYFVWRAVYRESGSDVIGGYRFDGMVVYYLTVTVLGKLVGGRDLEARVATDIYEGGLNRYLLFPARYLPFKYAQHVGSLLPSAIPFFVLGVVFVLAMGLGAQALPQPGHVLMALPTLLVANVLHFLVGYPLQLVAFWADNVWSLDVAKRFLMTFLGGVMLPLSVFPAPVQEVLEVLPFAYAFAFPARVMLGEVGMQEWLGGLAIALAWCAAFWSVGRAVWHRGQLQYTGIGI